MSKGGKGNRVLMTPEIISPCKHSLERRHHVRSLEFQYLCRLYQFSLFLDTLHGSQAIKHLTLTPDLRNRERGEVVTQGRERGKRPTASRSSPKTTCLGGRWRRQIKTFAFMLHHCMRTTFWSAKRFVSLYHDFWLHGMA